MSEEVIKAQENLKNKMEELMVAAATEYDSEGYELAARVITDIELIQTKLDESKHAVSKLYKALKEEE